jgi:spermidine/putrescine transport system substrate-binding protein
MKHRKGWVLVLGAVVVLLLLTLAACGGSDDGTATSTSSTLPQTNELNIYAWSGEIPESIIKDFEKETGVTVTFDTFDSNESMVTKLQSGATGYDLVNPSQYAVQQLAGLKLIQELDHSKLPSLSNVPESFQQAEYDPGNRWSVPVMWGTTALAYNSKYIKDDIDSWAALSDAKYKGKIMMLDNMLAAYIPALQVNGYAAGSTVKAEVDVATQWLMDQKPLLQGYNATNNAQLLAQGQVWIELAWNSQIVPLMKDHPELRYIYPKEGFSFWTDNLSITSSAKNVANAYKFIEYLLQPEVAAKMCQESGIAVPNTPMMELLPPDIADNAAMFAPEADMSRADVILDPAKATIMYQKGWTKVRAE